VGARAGAVLRRRKSPTLFAVEIDLASVVPTTRIGTVLFFDNIFDCRLVAQTGYVALA
jgi:hypothetical protein